MLGESAAVCRLRARLQRIAASDSHVLITGETGTGKELAARAVHAQSARRERPFIAVNCAALPETLVEGELFGYERGAYTGAVQSFPGRLKLADGGIVLLDEIGEMSSAAQAKLLRAVETREVWRVGGTRAVSFDIRIIAATNVDLESRVGDAGFRKDLYFRLNVVRVHLPPLRERREDVPLLIDHFCTACNRRFGRAVEGFAADVIVRLMAYSWPGNVRELKNLVEASFIESDANRFTLADLPEPWPERLETLTIAETDGRDRLIAAMTATGGNKADAARLLQISRMTLYRRLRRYELERRLAPS